MGFFFHFLWLVYSKGESTVFEKLLRWIAEGLESYFTVSVSHVKSQQGSVSMDGGKQWPSSGDISYCGGCLWTVGGKVYCFQATIHKFTILWSSHNREFQGCEPVVVEKEMTVPICRGQSLYPSKGGKATLPGSSQVWSAEGQDKSPLVIIVFLFPSQNLNEFTFEPQSQGIPIYM